MGCIELMPTIHPGSSIPELINFIKHSFRECEFDEVQNTLMEREKDMKIEIVNLSRDCDSLKKDIDILENSQSFTDLEKCRMGKEIEDLRREKLGLEEKLDSSHRKCEERDERLVRMGKEIEDLWHEKLDANQTIKELKRKEIEADQVLQELKRKDVEATQTIDELRVRLETVLAKMLRVNVEDLSKLINGTGIFAAAATDAEEEESVNLPNSEKGGSDRLGNDNVNADAEDGVVMPPEVRATSDNSSGSGGVGSSKKGGRDLAHSGSKEDGVIVICTSGPVYSSAVAESNGIVQDNEGKAAEVKGTNASVMQSGGEVATGKAEVSSCAGGNGNVIVLCDSDDETDPGQTNKRNRIDDSPMNWSRKRKTSTSTAPFSLSSRLEETHTDSDDESCSDTYMDNLVATFQSKGRSRK